MYGLEPLLFACVASGCGSHARSLCCCLNGVFLRAVTAVVLTALLLGLLHTVRFLLVDLAAEQDSYGTAVERVKHAFEDVERLQFVNQQRVFLLIGSVLRRLLEVVQLAEMFFPLVVDDIEQHPFLELLDHLFAMALGGGAEVDGDVIDFLAVGDGDQDVLIHLSFLFEHALDDGVRYLCELVHASFEAVESRFSQPFAQLGASATAELVLVEGHLHGKGLEHLFFQSEVVVRLTGIGEDAFGGVVNHVGDVHADAFAHQCVVALGVDEVTLLVHHVVVFNQAFADTEVVLLHFLLCAFDGVGNHRVLNHLAFLESHPVHDGGYTFGAEHTHQVVLQADIEDGATGVTLTSGTSAQLSVHTAALVAFRTDDSQTARLFHLGCQFDIRTTTCHVGGDGHHACTACLGYHLRLLLVELGVEDVMLDFADVEHLAQQLGYLDGGRTYQYRTALVHHVHYLVDDGVVFLAFGAVDTVVHVDTGDGFVGRDDHHVQFVYIPELSGFRLGGTGHTGEFVVHTEIVLEGDGGESLCRAFDFDVLFGFHGLVQSVRPPASLHDTSCLFIDNLHLAVVDDVIHIFLEQRISFQQLVYGVYALAFDAVVGQDIVFLLLSLFLRTSSFVSLYLYLRHLASDIGQDEEIRVVGSAGQGVDTFVGEVDGLVLLVDDEIELVGGDVHVLLVLLEVELLGLLQAHFDARFGEVFDERLRFRHTLEGAEERQFASLALFLVGGVHLRLRFGKQLGGECRLLSDEVGDAVFVFVEHLVLAARHRTGDDKGRTCVVNEYGVHLIDDGVVVSALYEVERGGSHVVSQVVEAELVVRAEGDVAGVGFASFVAVGLVFVDTIDGETEEHVYRSVPLGVTFGEVVIDGDHVYAFMCQCVEIDRQCRHEGLTLAGSHLGYLALV